MTVGIRRREFIAALGGASAAWQLTARAQQRELPVIALINGGAADSSAAFAAAFGKGLRQTGYAEGQNVTVEYHWVDGQFHRLPALLADLVRRRVDVIATPVSMAAALAAKAATATIPIVFGLSQDPVKFGLVASLARPGGNATGINFLNRQTDGKRLELLHELVPKAVHVALLINPANAATNAETTEQNLRGASRDLGLQLHLIHASTSQEIDAAFAALVRERLDALFVTPDAFFAGRRVQFATLAARDRIPAAFPDRESVEAGGLMSYGSEVADAFYEVGVYAGKILKGASPVDLPVAVSANFTFAINLKTARLLGIDVPRKLLAFVNELIE
jgi:putative tryptophan/tyrosine transport system substrate-binding protein